MTCTLRLSTNYVQTCPNNIWSWPFVCSTPLSRFWSHQGWRNLLCFVSDLRLVSIFRTEYTIFCFVLARHDICINDFWENREWIPRKPRARKGGKIGTPIHFTFLARNKLEASERKTHFLVVKNYEMGNIEEKPARHLSIADFVCSLIKVYRMDCVCVAITTALKKDCGWMPRENNV